MEGNAELLRCEELAVGYAGKPLVAPFDLSIEPGAFWVIVGRNGSGKSTFLRTVLGLTPPVSGAVRMPMGKVEMAYLAQHVAFDPLYPVRVRELVADGSIRGWSFLGPGRAGDAVQRALEAVGIADLADRTFRSLSGGQKQRALFARMLATGAKLVFLDEPTVGMDAVAEREVMELLVRLQAEYGLTVVVVSHSIQVALDHADQVLFFDHWCHEVHTGPPREVFGLKDFIAHYGPVLGEGG